MSILPVARRDARERALELLYESEMKSRPLGDVLGDLPLAPDDYTLEIVRGVAEHAGEHDALIVKYARGWSIDRMPVLDRIILRIGIEELGHRPDVPTAVVLDEAVELAKSFSTDDSSRFVNGMLVSVARELRGSDSVTGRDAHRSS
jgi:N utilization substance protein B